MKTQRVKLLEFSVSDGLNLVDPADGLNVDGLARIEFTTSVIDRSADSIALSIGHKYFPGKVSGLESA